MVGRKHPNSIVSTQRLSCPDAIRPRQDRRRGCLFLWSIGICSVSSTCPKASCSTSFTTSSHRPDTGADVENWLPPEEQDFEVNKIINGRVVNIVGDDVVVDVGYKSEGIIPLDEWYDEGADKVVPPQVGDEIQVLLDAVEDEGGAIVLSYRKAKRQKEWEDVIAKHKEGDVVNGKVTRKIKGGLLVDIGVNVFLPASQVDIRRPSDIADYIGKRSSARSSRSTRPPQHRRQPPQADRDHAREQKKKLLDEIEVGQIRKGIVKNIADFGAFVDLGGIDGLLHITDMSWGRINHPSDMVKIDQQIEVMVLHVDKDKREDRPGPQAEDAPARGRTSRASTRSAPGSPARSSTS